MRSGDQLPLDLPTFTNGGVILLALVIVAGLVWIAHEWKASR